MASGLRGTEILSHGAFWGYATDAQKHGVFCSLFPASVVTGDHGSKLALFLKKPSPPGNSSVSRPKAICASELQWQI